MARRKKPGLVKIGQDIVTAGHAAECIRKKFRGCSNREIIAVAEVVRRMAAQAQKRRK